MRGGLACGPITTSNGRRGKGRVARDASDATGKNVASDAIRSAPARLIPLSGKDGVSGETGSPLTHFFPVVPARAGPIRARYP